MQPGDRWSPLHSGLDGGRRASEPPRCWWAELWKEEWGGRCFCLLSQQALIDSCSAPASLAADPHVRMIALYDNEEVLGELWGGSSPGSLVQPVVSSSCHGPGLFWRLQG